MNELQAAYRQGFLDACEAWAFWKNGKQYCGQSSVIPLSEVLKTPEKIYGYNPRFGEGRTSNTFSEPK